MQDEARVNLTRLLQAVDQPLAGAWQSYYRKGEKRDIGEPRAYAILAFKKELEFRGFGDNLTMDTPYFGDAMKNRVIDFQKSLNMTADGVIGPVTSRRLFKKRIWDQSHKKNFPALMLCKQLNLESGFDPAAVGYVDPRDRGLAQINSFWHPSVSDEKAFSPEFSIPWAADYLAANLKEIKDIDAALAAHNVGRFYAKQWLNAGKPDEGIFTITGRDIAIVITNYIKLIKNRDC